jgi:Protein of unknown function (DUF1573)
MKTFVTVFALGVSVLFYACDQKQSATTESTSSSTPTTAVPVSNPAETQATASTTPTGAMPKLEFDKTQHDFGNIKEGEIVKHTFKFKNVGEAPLLISDVKPTCGCTTTNFTKTPVTPGGEGEIELQFDSSGKSGPQHKPVTVLANVEGGQTQLVLTAIVESKPKIDGPFRNQ